MYLNILSSVSEFLPRRVKRAALLKAMLLHKGIESESKIEQVFNTVGLHPTNTSDWLAKEAVREVESLPNIDSSESVTKWIASLPRSLRYETSHLLRRDVNINCRLLKGIA